MASNPAQSFVLRPVPQSDRRPKNLGEFIARVNADRGFRNVTEESLRKEMEAEAEANGILESKEVDMANGEGADGDGDRDGNNAEDDEGADQVGIEDLHQAIGDVRLHAEYEALSLHLDGWKVADPFAGPRTRMQCSPSTSSPC